MNETTKNIIIIGVSSILSATISHLITKKVISYKYENKMEEIIKDEINKFKKEYSEKMNSEPKKIPISQLSNEQLKKIDKIKDNTYSESFKEYNKMVESYPLEEDINEESKNLKDDFYSEDENNIDDEYDSDDIEDDEDYLENGEPVVNVEDDLEYPFVISQEEYDNDDNFTKINLLYYIEENKLIDPYYKDEILDVEEIIGKKNLNHFGDMSNSPNLLYIRNLSLNNDYEIQKIYGPFKKDDL